MGSCVSEWLDGCNRNFNVFDTTIKQYPNLNEDE